jgi:hypothetical protein
MKFREYTPFTFFVALGLIFAAPSRAATIPFDVRTVQSTGTAIQNITDAQNLLNGNIAGTTVYNGQTDILNFNDPSAPSGGLFSGDIQFPGISSSNEKDFALQATGSIEIPRAGSYTFGVSSDDGFLLTVGSNSMKYAGTRKAAESYSTFTFTKAGAYPVSLVYFQHHVSAELEFFASSAAFNTNVAGQTGSSIQLVNDVANGGLALINPGVNLPEPSALALLIPAALGLLLRRRRVED